MAIEPEDFKVRFPEYVCETDSRIQLFIDDSVVMLNETYWGTKYDLGLSYLTAHYLSISNKEGNGSVSGTPGPISSKSVDGASVTYAVVASDNEWLSFYNSTSYGRRYLALMKTLGVAACVI